VVPSTGVSMRAKVSLPMAGDICKRHSRRARRAWREYMMSSVMSVIYALRRKYNWI
jgi:hypothetical protein